MLNKKELIYENIRNFDLFGSIKQKILKLFLITFLFLKKIKKWQPFVLFKYGTILNYSAALFLSEI